MSLDPGLLAAHDFTPVRAALLRVLGGDAVAALVVTRIAWRCAGPQAVDGWWCGTHEALADEIGLSADQVRKAAGRLKAAGHIETEKRRTGGVWDQTLSYRPIVTDMSVCAHPAQKPDGVGSGAECHPAQEPNVPSLLETLRDKDARIEPDSLFEVQEFNGLEAARGKGSDYRFEDIWAASPMRNGSRAGKREAREEWAKMSYADKSDAFRGIGHYRLACDGPQGRTPKDLHRWLSHRMWVDWQEPPVSDESHSQNGQVIYAPRIATPKPSLPDGEVMLNDGRIQLADGTIVDRSPMPAGPAR